jgi:urea transport system ATP-binding protein
MLDLSNVDSFFGRSQILHGLSLVVPDGQMMVILGRNGTGKTTLLKTIMGLTDRIAGQIALSGSQIGGEPTFRRARAGIGYVPQGREIIPQFSIRENILMGTNARQDGVRAVPGIVGDLFPYLAANLERSAGLLSGGQQQQLAIARALAADPKLLLLDEPTEGIQPNIVAEIEDLIIRLNRQASLTVVLVEQNVSFARRAGNSFGMMEKGRIVVHGAIEELTDDLVHKHMAV